MAVIVTTLFSRQGVASTTIVEGRAVVVGASGVREDLPNVSYAPANTRYGVFIAFFPPDNFPRPTPDYMYTLPAQTNYNLNDGTIYGAPIWNYLQYLVPRSMWREPSAYTGELVALHHGKIGITDGCFVDSVEIRVPGARVAVGASGLITYTTNDSYAFATVERFQPDTNMLYIIMH